MAIKNHFYTFISIIRLKTENLKDQKFIKLAYCPKWVI